MTSKKSIVKWWGGYGAKKILENFGGQVHFFFSSKIVVIIVENKIIFGQEKNTDQKIKKYPYSHSVVLVRNQKSTWPTKKQVVKWGGGYGGKNFLENFGGQVLFFFSTIIVVIILESKIFFGRTKNADQKVKKYPYSYTVVLVRNQKSSWPPKKQVVG